MRGILILIFDPNNLDILGWKLISSFRRPLSTLKSSSITSMLFFRLRMLVNVNTQVNKTAMKSVTVKTLLDDFDEGQYNIHSVACSIINKFFMKLSNEVIFFGVNKDAFN